MKSLLVTALLLMSFVTSASAVTTQESLKTLQQYSAKDLEKIQGRTDKEIGVKVQEILSAIEKTVDVAIQEKGPTQPELLKELLRVSVMTFEADPSEAATELLLPLYKKDKKNFEKAMKNLPVKAQKELKESIKNSLREESQGNG